MARENNPNWRGGKTKHPKGYVYARAQGHPKAHNGYVLEHRLVMEKHIGRYLDPSESVFHKNKIKSDNHIDNLILSSSEEGKRFNRTPILKKDVPTILEMFLTTSAEVISRKFGVREARIVKLCRKYGVKKLPYSKLRGNEQKALELLNQGLSYDAVGIEMGCSGSTVRRAINAMKRS